MLRVLQNWEEIGECLLGLRRAGLPLHVSPEKNWDLFLLTKVLDSKVRTARVVDLGCGGGSTVKLLHVLGYREIYGIDLRISWGMWMGKVARMWRQRTFTPPYHLVEGDITDTHFQEAFFDIACSISTIEHGVDPGAFFREVRRIVKPEGLLFLTTDYWQDKIDVEASVRPFGLPWRIFSRGEIEELLQLAKRNCFELVQGGAVPSCSRKPVLWQNREYTFIAMVFRRAESESSLRETT